MVAMIERLRAASPEFDVWWAEHDVARFETRLRRFNHPVAGLLTFEYQLLAPAEWPSLTVAVQLPVPATIRRSASPSATTSPDPNWSASHPTAV